jgi:hypothetical protein
MAEPDPYAWRHFLVPPLVMVLMSQNILFKASRFAVVIHKTELVIAGDKAA